MASRFIDWLTNLTAKSTTIDGTEITHIGSSGLSQKATLANVIQYGGGATRNETAGNATVTRNTSGALWLEVAGQTAGNARGAGAFDWQATRDGATKVASGANSIAIGKSNTAAGVESIVIGSNSNAASHYARVIGESCYAGERGTAIGNAVRADNAGQFAFGQGAANGASQAQGNLQTLYQVTTDAVSTALTVANSTTYRMVIPAMRACAITGLVTAMSDATDGYKVKAWEIKCIITRDNSSNTRIVGTPTITELGADTEAASWAIASITADNTNESLAITVTGEAATNIRWQGSLFYGQVGY